MRGLTAKELLELENLLIENPEDVDLFLSSKEKDLREMDQERLEVEDGRL
jgi:hypothetical protein